LNSNSSDWCPVCLNRNGVLCKKYETNGDRDGFDCQACGRFEITRTVLINYNDFQGNSLTAIQRAALSHKLRTTLKTGAHPIITTDWMEEFKRNVRLPTPPEQTVNLIRLIGDTLSETGEGYVFDSATDTSLIGSFDSNMFMQLLKDLEKKKLIQPLESKMVENPRGVVVISVNRYGLTLDGWDRYEAERRGQINGSYGFIAMKFGELDLDSFVEDHIKPAVHREINYRLVDLRNVARAGIIDNIMREQIRSAAFVIVDLTHDNSGAYWEAGYAEGLGKPVVYICEREKFNKHKTHFDTNHCTTVPWSKDEPEEFKRQLIATLRRSLNLFPS
jgi:hypothetical protein